MTIYDAIKEMRRLSHDGESFAFTFMSYNSTDGTSDGIVEVQHARLMQRESAQHNRHAAEMERYMDLDTMQPRRFWHPLLMTFNGTKLTP